MAFNKNLDKITEREVVPDFYERLNTSKDIEYKFKESDGVSYSGIVDSGSSIKAPTKVSNVINKLILASAHPKLLQYDITKVITHRLHISPTKQTFGASIDIDHTELNNGNYELVFAVVESTGFEVTDNISVVKRTDYSSFTIYIECTLCKDEYIQLYFIAK